MLKELNINNALLSPKFDMYNNTYTVKVDENITSLDISYIASDNAFVSIMNNENIKDNDRVIISVFYEGKEEIYSLYINKISKQVFEVVDDYQDIVVKKEIPSYTGYLILVVCLVLILILYLFMFRTKKR